MKNVELFFIQSNLYRLIIAVKRIHNAEGNLAANSIDEFINFKNIDNIKLYIGGLLL